jgi:hypothetical protein
VVAQAGAKVGGETNVVKLGAAVESVDAVALADVLPDDVLVFFECLAGDVFQVLADQWFLPGHTGFRILLLLVS